jgi:phosphomannomutase/phosphoglucomutase
MRALGLDARPALLRDGRALPEPPPRPDAPRERRRAHRPRARDGRRRGHRLRRRRRPLGAVDARGEIIWGDKLLLGLSRAVLADHPGRGGARRGEVLADALRRHRQARRAAHHVEDGHSLIKAKMKEEHALLAGEMSGHLFFADRYFGFDDAVYAALRLLEILAPRASRCTSCSPTCPSPSSTPELRVDCPDAIEVRRWSARCSRTTAADARGHRRRRRPHESSATAGASSARRTRSPCSCSASRRHGGAARRDPREVEARSLLHAPRRRS